MSFSLILLAHWMGDFLLQTSDMATRKSHSIKWLTYHVATYSTILLVFSFFLLPGNTFLYYTLINALLHWVTDFFTSKVTAKYLKQPRIFFTVLGMDQLIHAVTLYLTFENMEVFTFR